MSKKQFSISLDDDLREKVDNYRWENRTTLTEAISEMVRQFFEHKEMQSERKEAANG